MKVCVSMSQDTLGIQLWHLPLGEIGQLEGNIQNAIKTKIFTIGTEAS